VTTGVPLYPTSSNFSYPAFQYSITQSVQTKIIQSRSGIACTIRVGDQRFTTPNKYWRIFPLQEFGIQGSFSVTAVSIAIEQSVVGTIICNPVYVHLYYKDAPDLVFTESQLVEINNGSYGIPVISFGYFTVPIKGVVPAGKTLVISVETEDGEYSESSIFMGSNSLGEYSPSYIEASECGIDTPQFTNITGYTTQFIWLVSNDTTPPVSDYLSTCGCQTDSCQGYCYARPWCSSSYWEYRNGVLAPPCTCDSECTSENDCCSDIATTCPNLAPPSNGGGETPEIGTTGSTTLSGGGIAGIVIAVIAVVSGVIVAIILVILYLNREKLRRHKLDTIEFELKDKERQERQQQKEEYKL